MLSIIWKGQYCTRNFMGQKPVLENGFCTVQDDYGHNTYWSSKRGIVKIHAQNRDSDSQISNSSFTGDKFWLDFFKIHTSVLKYTGKERSHKCSYIWHWWQEIHHSIIFHNSRRKVPSYANDIWRKNYVKFAKDQISWKGFLECQWKPLQ